ncbi:MAG: beta-ketoacyl-ACP synthase II [Actinobacteria bacterium]|nr:beta-ketoacyl-ACP synthase II [Actinomycetota bacterium]MBV8394910.1 beta-ketoacyl-ACP synthase II [Actinomycetota bacterium]MBV8598457.1 beta-ketoacyl-ACP synthase II [Actinomycetota bacterium]
MSETNGNGRRRVVVTGIGMVSPLGNDVESSWSSLIAGESGAGPITLFDHTDYPVHFACELKDFDPTTWIDRKSSRRMDRFAQLVLSAARMAEADSGIDVSTDPIRMGASIATGIGGLGSFQECYDVLKERGPDRVSPFSIPCIIPNMGAGWVSIELGVKGPLMSQCTACAASNMAIGDALDEIRLGRADVMFAGGTEAPITKVGIAGFDAMRALSRRNDDPPRASRPFDRERDGLVMGEAGAVLVLEELEHARSRGAKIYAELIGYGMSADAAHMTEPDPTGQSPARAMRSALADAGVDPTEVGYVNAHATSTPLGDAAETKVIKNALGEEHAKRTPVSSTKGATGHTFGAAGAIEAVFSILALRDGVVPPTINYEDPDPDCDLDYVPNEARKVPDLRVAVSNSFGFGGHNATIVLRRWDD